MKQPTQKDFEDAIMNNVPQLHYHAVEKIAKACYALALKMAQQAFEAAREYSMIENTSQAVWDFKTFQDYHNQETPHDTGKV